MLSFDRTWCVFDILNIINLEIGYENPQEILESLNSTGLDLSDVDLLRNYLLMNLDDKNVEYEGPKYSLSGLASKLLKRNSIDGPRYFLYKGRPLNDLRVEYENDQFLFIDK